METLLEYSPWLLSAAVVIVPLVASIHVLLARRDAASSIGWIGLIWFAPFLGSLFYFLLGINRIQRKARRLRKRRTRSMPSSTHSANHSAAPNLPPESSHLLPLAKLVGAVTKQPLALGNQIQPLHNGEENYPAMLRAIDDAKQSVALSVYIFNRDSAGVQFVDALGRAVARGIDVRVSIDDIGGYYSWNSVAKPLRRAGVRVAPFLSKLFPRFLPYANLCNHRKLLIVDGRVGFTGGMNITAEHNVLLPQRHPIRDVHFRLEGPIVAQLQEVFVQDWEFSTGEQLKGSRWFPKVEIRGTLPARGVISGPDADFEKLNLVYCGALACAQSRVRIITPYFLPGPSLVSALNTAALRGVQVDIFLPRKTDLHLVDWAASGPIYDVLEHGCKVWLTPPPFVHTKLILVDDCWSLFGSGNWDPRSLRLNFEFNVECYDKDLTAALEALVAPFMAESHRLTLAEMNARSYPIKIRDGMARLLTPYL